MKIARTVRRDVWRNLAVEEFLLELAGDGEPSLFFYRNDPALVIGKNQNPWAEIDVAGAAAAGVPVARRISGGGAVYHDAGNLNFAMLLPRAAYDLRRQFDRVVAALRRCGVETEVRDRTSLCVRGWKVSGHAFCLRGKAALHHGTLLVAADLGRMDAYLRGDPDIRRGAAVPSRPSTVANLSALAPDVTIEALEAALADEVAATCGESIEWISDDHIETWAWAEHLHRQMSWEWQFGHTPPFEATLAASGEPGCGRVVVSVRNGRVADVAAEGDVPAAVLVALRAEWTGRPFDPVALRGSLGGGRLPWGAKPATEDLTRPIVARARGDRS